MAKGVLYILLYIEDGKVDFDSSYYFPVVKEDAKNWTWHNVSNGSYMILVYDIEGNGVIQSRGLPAYSTIVNISGHTTG